MAADLALSFAALAAGFVGVTGWRANHRERRAEASHPAEGTLVEIDGHRVHGQVIDHVAGQNSSQTSGQNSGRTACQTKGQTADQTKGQTAGQNSTQITGHTIKPAPDIVLIHGSSGNTREFTFSLATKLAADYRVTLLDRPGLGYSDRINRSGASLKQQASLLCEAAEALGATNPIVLGQSYGGAVALAWAVHHPDRLSAVISVAGVSHPWDTPLDAYYKLTSHPILGPLVIPFLTAWVPDRTVPEIIAEIFTPNEEPPGYDAHIGTGLTLRRKSLRANAMQRRNLLADILALCAHYKNITVPLEIVHGAADDIVPAWNHAERLVKEVAQANLTLLPGIGHMPHHNAEPEVIAAIHRAAFRAGLR